MLLEREKESRDTQDPPWFFFFFFCEDGRKFFKRMQFFHEKCICTSFISSYIRTTRHQLVTCFVNIFESFLEGNLNRKRQGGV